MAVKYMQIVNIDEYQQKNDNLAWEYEVSLGAISTSDWLLIPINVHNISVALVFSATAVAKVQMTNNLIADVISGTGIVPFDWTSGAVSINTEDAMFPVTAIRLNVTGWTSGTVKMLVRAQ